MKWYLAIIIYLAAAQSTEISSTSKKPDNLNDMINEDAELDVPGLIRKYGYPLEIHYVTTEDDYILEIHRIPHGIKLNTSTGKVVVAMHGILTSSASYIVTGVDNALGYILADAGYDVWLANSRGNHYSRNHTTLNPDSSKEFWDFSFHEVGVYDLAAVIDYILDHTDQEDLFYVGHSQGTSAFYALTSVRQEYNDKLIAAFCLAPIAYMSNVKGPVTRFGGLVERPLSDLVNFLGIYEFLPSNPLITLAFEKLCSEEDVKTQPICNNLYFLFNGYNPEEMNNTILPIILGHFPEGTSTKSILHFEQEVASGYFRQYDEGFLRNLIKYWSLHPPQYDIEGITTPVYNFYSKNDFFSSDKDVVRLHKRLPNSQLILIADHKFNHGDFAFGIHAPELVYSRMLDFMSTYVNNESMK